MESTGFIALGLREMGESAAELREMTDGGELQYTRENGRDCDQAGRAGAVPSRLAPDRYENLVDRSAGTKFWETLVPNLDWSKEDEARKYFQQLVNAVDYCHSRGVCHRDLKASISFSLPSFIFAVTLINSPKGSE
ncbi:hypothetical protein LguiA_021875 [Lonicera macranthoides]